VSENVVMNDVRYTLDGAEVARQWIDSICDVYDEVFSAAPFFWREDESELHRERLVGLMHDSSFGIVVAHHDDELVGFAYGITVPAGSKRWLDVSGDLDDETVQEWPGRTFLLFDYAVRAGMRGKGVGHLLHDRLLGSRSEQRATLTVQPTALDTKRLYERWGWRMVGEVDGGESGAAPSFDVYLLDSIERRPGG
jgi:GNAT superfamily N-acetyltransferase